MVILSNTITTEKFVVLSQQPDHWIDSLYVFTLNYKNGDRSESLFLLTFVLLQFREMPLSIPIINRNVEMPLPRPPDSLFYLKNINIPKRFPYKYNLSVTDRDKYSHFFGNAFFAYNIRIFNLSKFMGIFVEYFEDTFKVEGAVDNKDIYVNALGEFFGTMLCEDDNLLPSEAISRFEFLLYVKL